MSGTSPFEGRQGGRGYQDGRDHGQTHNHRSGYIGRYNSRISGYQFPPIPRRHENPGYGSGPNDALSTSRPGSPWVHVDLDNGSATAVTMLDDVCHPVEEYKQELGENRPGTVFSSFAWLGNGNLDLVRAIVAAQPPRPTGPLLPAAVRDALLQLPRNGQTVVVQQLTYFENPDRRAVAAMWTEQEAQRERASRSSATVDMSSWSRASRPQQHQRETRAGRASGGWNEQHGRDQQRRRRQRRRHHQLW